jgi:hypothetical protein
MIHSQTAARLAQAIQVIWPTAWPAEYINDELRFAFQHGGRQCSIRLKNSSVILYWDDEKLAERIFDATVGVNWISVRDVVVAFLEALREVAPDASPNLQPHRVKEHLDWTRRAMKPRIKYQMFET